MLTGLYLPVLAAGIKKSPIALTFVGHDTDSGNSSTYNLTVSGVSNHAGKMVVVTVRNHGTSTATSVTVGGVSASLLHNIEDTDTSASSIWIATLDGSPTDDVVVEFGSGQGNCGASVTVAENAKATAYDTGEDTGNKSSYTATLNVKEGGAVIVAGGQKEDAVPSLDNGLTLTVDTSLEGGFTGYAAGEKEVGATASDEDFTMTWDQTKTGVLCAVSLEAA